MLLVFENNVYLRNERKSEWLQCVTFDSLIVDLYSIDTEKDQQTKFICITETTIETLSVLQDKEVIGREQEVVLPGKAIRTKQSNLTWGNAKILILTHKKELNQLSLWSFTDELAPTLLIKDLTEKKLDHHSFFDYVKVEG